MNRTRHNDHEGIVKGRASHSLQDILDAAHHDELLNLAAMQTLLQGGTVYVVPPSEVPDKQLLAALYRF